jgi:hypothetical protein
MFPAMLNVPYPPIFFGDAVRMRLMLSPRLFVNGVGFSASILGKLKKLQGTPMRSNGSPPAPLIWQSSIPASMTASVWMWSRRCHPPSFHLLSIQNRPDDDASDACAGGSWTDKPTTPELSREPVQHLCTREHVTLWSSRQTRYRSRERNRRRGKNHDGRISLDAFTAGAAPEKPAGHARRADLHFDWARTCLRS